MPATRFPTTSVLMPARKAPRIMGRLIVVPKYPVLAGMKTMIAATMPLMTPGMNCRALNGVPESSQPSPEVVTAPSTDARNRIKSSISVIFT